MKKSLLLLRVASALAGALCLAGPALAAPTPGPESDPFVRFLVELDREVLPADTRERAIVKIGFECRPRPRHGRRPPVNLALVIDRSGSMAGEKLAKAREAALEAVRRLAPDDVVALVAYDTRVETLVPAQPVRDGRQLEAAIRRLEAGGNTALHGGVQRGAAEVRRHLHERGHVNRVLLLSDGLANVGPSSPDELGRLGELLGREGIAVTTIGLGLGFNEDLMTRLARRSEGNTYFVEHSGDLPRIFSDELGEVLNVVARRVAVEIEFPAGITPRRFVGRDGSISGRRAEFTLGELLGGREKFALVEVDVDPMQPGVEREIARATARYEDAVSAQAASQRAACRVTFSARRDDVVSSANHRVQAAYAENLVALAKDEAVALVDQNRRADAAAVLRQQAMDLRRVADTYGNVAVGEVAAAMAPAAAKVEEAGLGNAERKAFRAEAAQTVNQQSSGISPRTGPRR